jgi:F-type H+-transporting ATPase subunit b
VDFNATLIGQTIAMIVFVWFCMKFIWPPVMAAIDTRQKEIADGLAAAERGQTSLVEAKHEADKIIASAREQARGIVDQANVRANSIIDEGRAEGAAQRQREISDGFAQIELERQRARDELRQQVASIAVAGAERILAREIDASAHRALLDQLAREL